jgi:hypothetical protein
MTGSVNLHSKLYSPETDLSLSKKPNPKTNGRSVNLFTNPWARRALWATAAIATAAIAYALFQTSQPPASPINRCILYEAMLKDNQAANCYLNLAREGNYLALVRIARAFVFGELGATQSFQKSDELFKIIMKSHAYNFQNYMQELTKMCYYNPTNYYKCLPLE